MRPVRSSQTGGWTHCPLHWEADPYPLHHQGSLLLSFWWIFWLAQGRLSLGHGNAVKETVRLIQKIPRETSITVLITIDTCTGMVLKWSDHWLTVCNSCIKHNAIAEYLRQLSIYHIQIFWAEGGRQVNGKLSLQKWHMQGENCFISPKICLADE